MCFHARSQRYHLNIWWTCITNALQAAQALEPASQIAFQLLASNAKVVMVGDSQQLPATVLSKAATASNLTQSLFERLQQVQYCKASRS